MNTVDILNWSMKLIFIDLKSASKVVKPMAYRSRKGTISWIIKFDRTMDPTRMAINR
jgi:hypothetical protein